MTTVIPVKINSAEGGLMQKCIIPQNLFKDTDFKIGDYVTVTTTENLYICRLFFTNRPHHFIYVNNVVTSMPFVSKRENKCNETTNFPEGLTLIKPFNFERILVKVVCKTGHIVNCPKTVYEGVIFKLLKSYVIKKNCVFNCSDFKFTDLFDIHCIVISETFPETFKYGKLFRASLVDVVDIVSVDQMLQIDKFQHIQLGGINDDLNVLKLLLHEKSSKILMWGPSGCGKSSLIKIFCSAMNGLFVIIDGLKHKNLTMDKCNSIYDQFCNYLKIFPNKTCILFIDHIDLLAPHAFKEKPNITSILVNTIYRLQDINVSVVAAGIHRQNINSKVSSLFVREVNLGIPSLEQRTDIVKVITKSLHYKTDNEKVARNTPGFVGQDILLLVKEAISNAKKNTVIEGTELKELSTEDFQVALTRISPSVLKTSVWNMKVKPVYWKDIGGMQNIKQRLQMCIEWPLHNPGIFKKVDLPCPRGVLLFGPPGCCKTTLARGLATECNANFFAATPAQIYSPYVGESEKNITELFYQARLSAPSIIFLDEIDCLVSQRKLDKKSHGVGEKVLSALLNEMDGFGTKMQFQCNLNFQKLLNDDEAVKNLNNKTDMNQHSGDDVIVVAATNRPDLIDDALLRPGRFDIILYVPPPNEEERESVLQTLTENKPVKNVNLKNIAEKTKLYSGADLKNLCNEAAMNALRKDISALFITEENFYEALNKVQPSITKQQVEMYEKLSSKYGTFVK